MAGVHICSCFDMFRLDEFEELMLLFLGFSAVKSAANNVLWFDSSVAVAGHDWFLDDFKWCSVFRVFLSGC